MDSIKGSGLLGIVAALVTFLSGQFPKSPKLQTGLQESIQLFLSSYTAKMINLVLLFSNQLVCIYI